jgi:hypothetical protein
MSKTLITSILFSVVLVAGVNGPSYADPIVRYECNIVGTNSPEPVGDRERHSVQVTQTSCVALDGLMKGASFTGISINEWDGTKGTLLLAGGVHRMPGSMAVTEAIEISATVIVQDGKPVGVTGSGKVLFKFASGAFASLAGKTYKLTYKSTGPTRFEQEYSE